MDMTASMRFSLRGLDEVEDDGCGICGRVIEDNPHHEAMHYPPNRIALKHGQVITMTVKYASLTKQLFLCFFGVLITAAQASLSRELLQRNPGERVIIDESNSASFHTLVTNAAENSTIEVHVDSLELADLVTISTRGLLIEGQGSAPVNVDCTHQGGLQINATLVVLRHLRIRYCRNSAVSIFNPDVQSDPFDFDFGRNITSIEVRLEDLEFVNNDATETQGQGGAIRIGPGTGVLINGSYFLNNSASTGGAIVIDSGGSLRLLESTFLSNEANLVGGAIAGGVSSNWSTSNSTFSIQNCTFLKNYALSGGEDPSGLTLFNGAPLENSVFLKFPSPSPSGGAIYVHGFNEVEIKRSRFEGNRGVPAGGALYISDNRDVRVDNCTFDDNAVTSENPRSTDLELGGAVYLVFTNMRSTAKIERCLFRHNHAAFGGAIHTVTQLTTKLSIENSLFEDNSADLAAGAILMRNSIQSKIRNVRFVRNKAVSGGALMLTNGAGAFLYKGPSTGIKLDIYFTNNSALDGGGVFLLGAGQTSFQSVRFEGNRAGRNGGGVCLIESLPSSRATIQESVFRRNSALRGGGIYVDSISHFTLTSLDENYRNEFVENRALAGGALHIRPSSPVNNLIKIIRSLFLRNQAVSSREEAGIEALDLPEVHIEVTALGRHLRFHRSLTQVSKPTSDALLDPRALDACNPGGGGAICLLIAQVPERAPIEVLISETRFVRNQGSVGGALFLATNVETEWIATCASSGSAVESLTSKPCKAMLISQVEFTKNQAKFAGGAIFASNPISVYFDRNGKGKQVSLQSLSSEDPIFQQNSIQSGGFGPNLASNAASLEILKPKRNPPHKLLFSEHNSGTELEGGIELMLLDVYNQSVSNGIIDSTMSVSISSSIISGQRVAMAERGIIKFTKVIARGSPDHHTLIFRPNSDTTKPIKAEFSIRQCVPGEFRIDDQNICDECREDYFGFNFTYNCDGCPDNAICPGGVALVPEDGYWHSTPFSPILHECILEDACSYDDRKTKLSQFFNDPLDLNVSSRIVQNEDYPQCADGYEGVLCGSCVDGYGHVIDGECCKCKQLWLTALLIGIVCIWTLFLLISTAQSAFDTIREMQDVHSVHVVPSTQVEVLPRSVSESSGISAKKFASESGDENVDHIMAAERVAEIIKILTNFLQITSVGVGINASWTQSIAILLVIEDSISSISSGASFAPMECLIKHLEDRSLIGIVLRALFPIILTGIYILINMVKSRFDRKNLKRNIIIQVIVGLFFAYDTVSEMLMRIVSCISLDVVSEDTSIVLQRYGAYAIARESYWAEDTRHICWKGSHGIVAGVLGVPGLVLFTFGLPLLMAGFLIYKRQDDTVLKAEFLDTYGFVFQAYRVKFVYWESMVMLRKASMAAVIVYSYDLGPNLQAAIALGILIFSLLAQFLAQPFKYPSLNVLESLSLLASIFVFYAGVIFSDPNTSYKGKITLSAIILMTNISIVGVFLYCLFNAYDHLIVVKLRLAKSPVPDKWFGRVKTLSLVQAEKVKEKLVASAKRPGAVDEVPPEATPVSNV